MLQLIGVCKSFGGIQVLAPLDLALERGATTVLIGPSGCGKSTILRLMIGLLRPDAGQVLIDASPPGPRPPGTVLDYATPLRPDNVLLLRRRMGYVIQEGGLFPHLTARGNACLMPNYLRWDRARTEQRLAELVELTRLPPDSLGKLPMQLSGGQRQRVGLIRALMLDPELLLMDEPLAALDPIVRFDLQTDLRDIFRRLGKTVVLVTHDIREAAFFGDRIVLLRAGRVVQDGTWRDLSESPADPFVTRFLNAQRGPELWTKEPA